MWHKLNIINLQHIQTLFVIQRNDLNSCHIWLFLFNLHIPLFVPATCPQALLIYVPVQEGPQTAIKPKLIENELQLQLLFAIFAC